MYIKSFVTLLLTLAIGIFFVGCNNNMVPVENFQLTRPYQLQVAVTDSTKSDTTVIQLHATETIGVNVDRNLIEHVVTIDPFDVARAESIGFNDTLLYERSTQFDIEKFKRSQNSDISYIVSIFGEFETGKNVVARKYYIEYANNSAIVNYNTQFKYSDD